MPIAVNEQSTEIAGMAKQWAVLEPLMAGTPAMRAGGVAFLPRWPNEEDASYKARLATATLMPAYRRTVGVMAGKPFAKALTLSDDMPPALQAWAEDIDLQGVSLHSFAAEMFAEAVGYGLAGVLVDYPTQVGPVPETKAKVEAAGIRPYFVRIKHGQILGCKAALQDGRMRLTQLRLMESVDEDDGPFGVTSVAQVRVLYPGGWETYRNSAATKDKGRWLLHDKGLTTLNVIPFVPFYGARGGYMCGRAPLLDLAYLNIKHWQSQSDQDTIMHVARVPILSVRGVQDSFVLTVGASTAVNLGDSPNAEMKFVEHTGAAIASGEAALAALQDQMIQTGAELLVKKPGNRTAAESTNDAEGNKSDLQRMAETFEDSLDQALWLLAQYANETDGGSVSLFSDYGASTLSDASASLVKELQGAGVISKVTAINELKRRGVLSHEVDAETEAATVADEGPALGTLADAGGLPGAGA